jgi:hypothetical protein
MQHPAANKGVCLCLCSGYKGIIQNQMLLFAYIPFFFLVSPIFKIVFNYSRSCTTKHSSNITSLTPELTTKKLFLISKYSLKIFLDIRLFIICITFEGEYCDSAPMEKCTYLHQYR